MQMKATWLRSNQLARKPRLANHLPSRSDGRLRIVLGAVAVTMALAVAGETDASAQPAGGGDRRLLNCQLEPPAWARILQAEVDVTWGAEQRVTPLPELFAGEHACLRVALDRTVNIDRRRYQERECWTDWFGGIGCKWVTRIANHFNSPAQVPLAYALHEAGTKHSPGEANGSTSIELLVPPGSPAHIRSSVALHAMIGRPGQFGRATCGGDPEICSQGAYSVTVLVNSMPRAEALLQYLSETRLSYDEIAGPRIQNENLRSSDRPVRIIFARALLAQAQNQHDATSADRQKILELALEYAPPSTEQEYQTTREDILGALGASYVANGQFGRAEAVASEVVRSGEARIASGGSVDAGLLLRVATNLLTLADVSWIPKAGLSDASAREAAGSLRKARSHLLRLLREFPLDSAATAAKVTLSNASIRLAQVLRRTGTELAYSEGIESLVEARRRLPPSLPGRALIANMDHQTLRADITVAMLPERAIMQSSWRETTLRLPLKSGWTLNSFGADPNANPERMVATTLGASVNPGRQLSALLGTEPVPPVFSGSVCVADMLGLGDGAFVAIEHIRGQGSDVLQSRLLTSSSGEILEPGGRIDGAAFAREAGPRGSLALAVATLPSQDPGSPGDSPTPSPSRMLDVRVYGIGSDGTVTPTPTGEAVGVATAGSGTLLRISPRGDFAVLGVSSSEDQPKTWQLLRRTSQEAAKAKYVVEGNLECPGPSIRAEPIDDVILLPTTGTEGESAVLLALGQSCGIRRAEFRPSSVTGGRPQTLRFEEVNRITSSQDFARLAGEDRRQLRFAWLAPDASSVGTLSVRRGTANGEPRIGLIFGGSKFLLQSNPSQLGSAPSPRVFVSDLSPVAVLAAGAGGSTRAECRTADDRRFEFSSTREVVRILNAEPPSDGAAGPIVRLAIAGVAGSVASYAFQAGAPLSDLRGRTTPLVISDFSDFVAVGERADTRLWALSADRRAVYALPAERSQRGGMIEITLTDPRELTFVASRLSSGDDQLPNSTAVQLIERERTPAERFDRVARIGFTVVPDRGGNEGGPGRRIVEQRACGLGQNPPAAAAVAQPSGVCSVQQLAQHFDGGRTSRVQLVTRAGSPMGGAQSPVALAFLPSVGEAGRITVLRFPLSPQSQPFHYESATPVDLVLALSTVAEAEELPTLVVRSGDDLVALGPNQSGPLGSPITLSPDDKEVIEAASMSVLSAPGRVLITAMLSGAGPGGMTRERFIRLSLANKVLTFIRCEDCAPPSQVTRSRLAELWGTPAIGFGGRMPLFAADPGLDVLYFVRTPTSDGNAAPWFRLAFDETKVTEVRDVSGGIPLAVTRDRDGDRLLLSPRLGTLQIWSPVR